MKWNSCESINNTGILKVRSHTQSVVDILLQFFFEFVTSLQNRICVEAYILRNKNIYYGSHFCNKSNGILVLVWFFFFRQNLTDEHFWRIFSESFKRKFSSELKFEQILHLWSFFIQIWGFKCCHIGLLWQLTRDIFRAINA